MNKLLFENGFACKEQYFRMIVQSFKDQKIDQAKGEYKKLPKSERTAFFLFLFDMYQTNEVTKFFLGLI